LEPPGWGIEAEDGELIVYESGEWVKRFRRREIGDFWQTYLEIVSSAAGNPAGSRCLSSCQGLKIANKDTRYVVFNEIETADDPALKILFLVAPFEKEPIESQLEELVELIDPLHVLLNPTADRKPTLDQLTRFASRAYPYYLLADQESWLAIEREGEANLALSAEEEKVLRSVSIPSQGASGLPVFINGRAGSGKSTMLLYLFADYCYRKWLKGLPGELLFLTYNERLLDVAKNGVRNLLSCHHRFLANKPGNDVGEIDTFFQPFQRFLIELLPPLERKRFEPERKISFHRFKELFTGAPLRKTVPSDEEGRRELLRERELALRLPEAKMWSPELCWHLIRAFIKGYLFEEYMTPEDYHDLPRRERTISEDTFAEIWATIWDKWYRPITSEERGYWDDQDLIRAVLQLGCYRPEYAVIFCDEAQDFTRIELQLVMRLSMLSQYDLGYEAVHNLPFAFAGDPFQTLNPTGFRWSSLQAAFYDEVVAVLDPTKRWNLEINFQELTYNYRSTPPIVRATNLIQLWRHVLFSVPEIQPQMWWEKGNFPEPQKFILGRNFSPDELKRHAQQTIILVPCEEGQELSYIQQDPVLSAAFPQAAKEDPPKNVLSAITAKGLEFKRVILYKFGEACDVRVWQFLETSEEHPLEFEYFFNKLYVAASRAMERLFVVDSDEGDRRLWCYASASTEVDKFLQQANNAPIWEESIQTISLGAPESVSEIAEDDPYSVALEFKTKGLSLGNADLLRRAKQYYSILGDPAEAQLCEALALRFEGNFSAAGRLFLDRGNPSESWQSFWEGMCWPELRDWYEQYGRRRSEAVLDVAYDMAVFMTSSQTDVGPVRSFTRVLTDCIGRKQLGNSLSRQWREVVKEYVYRTAHLGERDLPASEWQDLGTLLRELDKTGYPGLVDLAGTFFYRATAYGPAVVCWEQAGITEKAEYYRAKAEVIGFPDGLAYLEKAKDYERIVSEWEKIGGSQKVTEVRWLKHVGPALEQLKRYREAFFVYTASADTKKARDMFAKGSKQLTNADRWKGLLHLIDYLVHRHLWIDAVQVLQSHEPDVVDHDTEKRRLSFDLARELAYSDLDPSKVSTAERQQYERFIEEILKASDWHKCLTIQEVGCALERIGGILSCLKFYERFQSDSDPELRRYAQGRWIVSKRKQEEHVRAPGGQAANERADQIHTELSNRAFDWGIRADTELSPLPMLRPRGVEGLPLGTSVEHLGGGSIRFQVGGLEVRTNATSKLVLITDTSTFKTLRVDLAAGQVSGLSELEMEQGSGIGQISFHVPTSGYSGVLSHDAEKTCLELRVQGAPGTVSLEF